MMIRMTVNGEAHTVDVQPRTQLAEILRDSLDLTATHLACEQGVCGACTVMVDDRPVRSCITFAGRCEGARVETIEGYSGDVLMDRLRTAFSEHHALQCGFCTPGMLATARDIVARLSVPDEARIRNELSGNLCRCTGYVGIVRAIADVIRWRQSEGIASAPAKPDAASQMPRGFDAFEAKHGSRPAPAPAAPHGRVAVEDGWTVVEREVVLNQPVEVAWSHFRDLHAVARCLPGAVLEDAQDGRFSGLIEVRFGLISARFQGEGTYALDDANRVGELQGAGKDKGGQSNVSGAMTYRLSMGADPGTTRVAVTLRFRIQGMLAQFNRPELVTGFVDFLLGQFISNCEQVLSGGTLKPGGGFNVLAMLWSVLKARVRAVLPTR